MVTAEALGSCQKTPLAHVWAMSYYRTHTVATGTAVVIFCPGFPPSNAKTRGGQRTGPTYGQPSHARPRKTPSGTCRGQCRAWQSRQRAMMWQFQTCHLHFGRGSQILWKFKTLILDLGQLWYHLASLFWSTFFVQKVLAAMDAFWNKTFQAQGMGHGGLWWLVMITCCFAAKCCGHE